MSAKPAATGEMIVATAKYYPSIHDGHGSQRGGARCVNEKCVMRTADGKGAPHFATPKDRLKKAIEHLRRRGMLVPRFLETSLLG